MTTVTNSEILPAAAPQHAGSSCRKCAAPLAGEQRYCLQCGEPTELAAARLPWLAEARQAPAAATAATVATAPAAVAPVAAPAQPLRPPEVQAAVDRQNQHPRTESKYAIYGAAGATAILLTALVAGFVGAGLADGNETSPAPVMQATVAAPAGATGATAATTLTSDWPAGSDGWTVIVKQFDKAATQPAAVLAFKAEVAAKGLDSGALDSDEFGSLDAGKFVVYSGTFDGEKQAKSALKAVKAKGFAEAEVAEVSSGGDTGAKDSETVGDDKLKELDNLSPEESAKQRLKLPDETATEGEPPPEDDKESGGGSDELSIGSLGDHFGMTDGASGDVIGFDVNSLKQLTCVWPLQTGDWTIGRTLKLAPGTPLGWSFPSPVNDFFSGSATTPGATFCTLEEQGMSAALAFKGRYATATAARKALKKDAEMKALGAHVVRVIPIAGTTPAS